MTGVTPDRVIVFIDGQNMYRGARRAFFRDNDRTAPSAPNICGQFHPRALAELLVARRSSGRDGRGLAQVRIYRGQPDGYIDRIGHAASERQVQVWRESGVEVFQRPLQYLSGRPPQEKGIDVAIAVDLVRLAHDDSFDVAIVCSTDSDIAPAIETVIDEVGKTVEVAGWRDRSYGQRIFIPGRDQLFVHWLYRDNYEQVADTTRYADGLG